MTMSSPVSAALLDLLEEGHRDANATRYLSAVGLVFLLYDHALTFSDEVELVWKAKPSFAKHLFLFNRYLVAGCLIAVAYYMNDFSGPPVSNATCQRIVGASSLLGVSSIGTANVLVLLRVVTLWDRNRKVMLVLTVGFLISFFATFGLMVAAICTILPAVAYSSLVRICYTPKTSPVIVGVWAAPMFFELLVLICVCWNAIDRPRASNTPLTRVLQRDGITFFLALTALRVFNLVMAAVARPALVFVGVFFVWAMTTLVLNRSVLNIQKAGCTRRIGLDGEDSLELGTVSALNGLNLKPPPPSPSPNPSNTSPIRPRRENEDVRFLSPASIPHAKRTRGGPDRRTRTMTEMAAANPNLTRISIPALTRSSSLFSTSEDGHDAKTRFSDSEYGYGPDDFQSDEPELRKLKKFWKR